MKIWEIDRGIVGKRYYETRNKDYIWEVNRVGGLDRVKNDTKTTGDICSCYVLDMLMTVDFEEVKQFSEDEKIIIKNMDDKFKYIARDDDGILVLFSVKPRKNSKRWSENLFPCMYVYLFKHLFQSIRWSDEEPTLISDIVGNM